MKRNSVFTKVRAVVGAATGLGAGGLILASGCDVSSVRTVARGLTAFADLVEPEPEPTFEDALRNEIEDWFD